MDGVTVRIITKSEDLPDIEYKNFFHSKEFFCILKESPEQTPYMAVAEWNGKCVAHLLAIVRRRSALLPPHLYSQGRIFGEGEYGEELDKDDLFGLMLQQITKKLKRQLCLYIECSNMSQKMFGYKAFRKQGYFPINWQEVRNSLHSKLPEDRLNKKQLTRISKIYDAGVKTYATESEEEVRQLYKILKNYYRTRVQRYLPSKKHFLLLSKNQSVRCFVTTYKGKVIGGSVCTFSEGDAYLWYLASRKKRYPHLHPNFISVWYVLKYAHQHHFAHVLFMDAGLPFKKNMMREFTLGFGGKPTAKYRWFRCSIPWINQILAWIYRE